VAAAAVTGAFVINFCAWIYKCGCRSWWAGAATYCNIHTPGMKHCPWCSYNFGLVLAFILVPQFAISLWPTACQWRLRLAMAIAAFPVFGVVIAVIYGVVAGYWKG
jgi:hypothetical protein